MASCKECVHVEACEELTRRKLSPKRAEELLPVLREHGRTCEHFKDRARFVELPCVAGEYVYVIEPIFGKSIEHTIRRRKIKSIEPHAEIKFYGSWIHDFLSGFGRYIFSTYEEAEQALKERESNA